MSATRRGRIRRLLHAEGDPLVQIGWAIGGMLTLAAIIAAVALVVGAQVLDIHGHKAEPLSATTLYDLLKVAFAVAAGVGGVIALVTAYRRQRYIEFAQALAQQQHQLAIQAEDRAASDSVQERELAATRLFNERFTTVAAQLGDDKPAVRLAGVYAMAGLADDWAAQRQTCVDVLCAYLRMPYQPDPGEDAHPAERQAFQALREVRHTVIRVITAHLRSDGRPAATAQDWRGLDLDFTGTVFDGGSFTGAEFTGGWVRFNSARFVGGQVAFSYTKFSGDQVHFEDAQFSGGQVDFSGAQFVGGRVDFDRAEFSGGEVDFGFIGFSGGTVDFEEAKFTGSQVKFSHSQFRAGEVRFNRAQFSGGRVDFFGAAFSGSDVRFYDAKFSGGYIAFPAWFSGGRVDFEEAKFTGGQVDFSEAAGWTAPPQFPDWETPPGGLTLPSAAVAYKHKR